MVLVPAGTSRIRRAARAEPAEFVRNQRAFLLAKQKIPLILRKSSRALLQFFRPPIVSRHATARPAWLPNACFSSRTHTLPTLQVCLERPLEPLMKSGELAREASDGGSA